MKTVTTVLSIFSILLSLAGLYFISRVLQGGDEGNLIFGLLSISIGQAIMLIFLVRGRKTKKQ